MQQLASSLAQTYPDTNRNRDLLVKTEFEAYRDVPGGGDTNLVVMLMTLGAARPRDCLRECRGTADQPRPGTGQRVALRLAVGAGRWRLLRQLRDRESAAGDRRRAARAVCSATRVINAFRTIEYPTDIPLKLTFDLDKRALIVGIVVAAGSAVLSSLLPAWRATRTDLVRSLKDAAGTDGGEGGRALGPQPAGVRSGRAVADVGDSHHLHVSRIRLAPESGARFPYRRSHFRELRSRARPLRRCARGDVLSRPAEIARLSLPGVKIVALASTVPMRTDNLQVSQVAPEGFTFAPGIESVNCPSALVDEGYFDTTGIRIVEGRGFRPTDTVNRQPSPSSTSGSPHAIGPGRAPSASA